MSLWGDPSHVGEPDWAGADWSVKESRMGDTGDL